MKEVYIVFRRQFFLWDDYHDTPLIFFSKKEEAEKEMNKLIEQKINGVTYHVESVINGDTKQLLTEMQNKLNLL